MREIVADALAMSGKAMDELKIFGADTLSTMGLPFADDGVRAAVCVLNGEFTVKFVDVGPAGVRLRPANDAYEPIRVEEGDSFEVWGVVTYVIHKVLRRK